MKYAERKRRKLEAYADPRSDSPLLRTCPKCEAHPGERCWNLKRLLYPVRINEVHPERRAPRK